ncbi:unnamed protein product [Oppiella nova]|uniref:Uncharacterized protein n=1 Tax=Oppiella nova TaxID=334625 RepID=A0A7R9LCP6_9ACAR|nr:unnamed protein product [Oppiella nova]CAG2161465.1 unnamed protein product [Oppiella nova]
MQTDGEVKASDLENDREQIKRIPIYGGKPDFRVDYYYLQEWMAMSEDCERYKKSMTHRGMKLAKVSQQNKLIVANEYFDLFWLPDVMISNSKEVKQQSELVHTILLQIYFVGDNQEHCHMEYKARYYAIVSCPMDFHDAPIDLQTCSIQMRSFAFNMKKIQLNWKEQVEFNPDLRLLEHDYKLSQETKNTTIFDVANKLVGVYTPIANKLVGVYTPSILIVLITFCSFWLGLNTTSERVTIGITALLALVTQFNDARRSLPATSYITVAFCLAFEIDRWMIMCMVCVSAQMVQCTLVDFVYHRQQQKEKVKETTISVIKHFRTLSQQKQNNNKNNNKNLRTTLRSDSSNSKRELSEEEPKDCFWQIKHTLSRLISVPVSPDKPEYLPMRIDAASRILFPLFFGLICLIYWPTMLSKEIDRWMIMCMVCVSAQMVQCTLVDFVYHRQQQKEKVKEKTISVIKHFRTLSQQKQKNNNNNLILRSDSSNSKKELSEEEPKDCFWQIKHTLSRLISVPVSPDKPEYLPMRIDAASRILFPLFFGLICLIYWPTMLSKIKNMKIFFDILPARGLRYDYNTPLSLVSDEHLSRTDAVFLSDVQHLCLIQ